MADSDTSSDSATTSPVAGSDTGPATGGGAQALSAAQHPTFAVRVISLDNKTAAYVAQFPYQPRLSDCFSHTADGPMIYIQNTVWTPKDEEAVMTIYVG